MVILQEPFFDGGLGGRVCARKTGRNIEFTEVDIDSKGTNRRTQNQGPRHTCVGRVSEGELSRGKVSKDKVSKGFLRWCITQSGLDRSSVDHVSRGRYRFI